jgi:hypothetical protein
MQRRPSPLFAAVAVVAVASIRSPDAYACGGCFGPATETTLVTGHRMALAVSPTQTVLWDQIKYAGSPSEFAWVLPVRSGAVLELSNDAWFETLDAATSEQIVAPPPNCATSAPGNSGCGARTFPVQPVQPRTTSAVGVTVTHEGSVGPYETVTLHANVPNALPAWLMSHGYKIDPSVAPIIDAYTSEGFDFIALRLLPGQGVQQMKPVRILTPGIANALPLRMVAAGTGESVAITLFVIGEGRWEAQNFPNASIDPAELTWDFTTHSSDYATKRLALMAQGGGRTWNNAFASQGSLLSQDQANGRPTFVSAGSGIYGTLAEAYVAQGLRNGETTVSLCEASFATYAGSMERVDGTCLAAQGSGAVAGGADGGVSCAVQPDQIDATVFACGSLDDIAVALVGMHPRDVWLTRLEANLPRAALGTDLLVQASASQLPISNVLAVTQAKGDPCPAIAGAVDGASRAADQGKRLAMMAAVIAALGARLSRRRRRFALAAA